MSKRRKKGSGTQFVAIFYPMAKSDAWRSLSGQAVKVFIELHSRYNGGNNGDLSLSLDEAARMLRIGKGTAQRAFRELEEKGFIVVNKRGTWYGRRATTYRVTCKPHGPSNPTNEWKYWSRPISADRRTTDQKNRSSVLKWVDDCLDEPALVPTKNPMGPPQNPSGS